jgi:hypothetical protein
MFTRRELLKLGIFTLAATRLSRSARDAWATYQKTVTPDLVCPQKQYGFEWGISPQREREILADWKNRQAS